MSVKDIEAAFGHKLDQFSTLDATVKFDFANEVLLVDGTKKPAVLSTDDGEADCTIGITPEDLMRIIGGELDPTMAFMTGRLKVKGSTTVAMKLSEVLK
jgi:putative sterol carrier protein